MSVIPAPETTDTSLEELVRRFTPTQRARLARLDRAPWKWFITDRQFFALVAAYDRDARIRYWEVLSRVTSYAGEDYRIKPNGVWIRATPLQYDQAPNLGIERRIGVTA